MISVDRFRQIMNTGFVMNMLTTHKYDEMTVTPNGTDQFNIQSIREGRSFNYSLMYHTVLTDDYENMIAHVTDDIWNTCIRWNGQKYELVPYRTNVPFTAIDVLLHLMNYAIDYYRSYVESIMRKWICKMEDNPDIAEFSWMDHTKDNGDYEIIIDYIKIPRKARVYAHFENGVLYEIRCCTHMGYYNRASLKNSDDLKDTCWICNNKETGLKDMSDGNLSAELLYDMLKNPKEDLLPLILREGKKKMIKQKKKVYPNLFERPGINAGIKDIQIHHKNDKTTTTVVWTDLDEKGKNKITTVSCPTRCVTTQTGIAMAIAKRYFGGRNEFKRVAEEAMVLYTKRACRTEHSKELKKRKQEENNNGEEKV